LTEQFERDDHFEDGRHHDQLVGVDGELPIAADLAPVDEMLDPRLFP
jgi:hypothetical protein